MKKYKNFLSCLLTSTIYLLKNILKSMAYTILQKNKNIDDTYIVDPKVMKVKRAHFLQFF